MHRLFHRLLLVLTIGLLTLWSACDFLGEEGWESGWYVLDVRPSFRATAFRVDPAGAYVGGYEKRPDGGVGRSYVFRLADPVGEWTELPFSGAFTPRHIETSGDGVVFVSGPSGSESYEAYLSIDGGSSWERHTAIDSFAGASASREGVLLVPTDSGFYRSNDDGATWMKLKGAVSRRNLSGSPVWISPRTVCGSVDAVYPPANFNGANAVWCSNDAGASWHRIGVADNQRPYRALAAGREGVAYAGGGTFLYRLENEGERVIKLQISLAEREEVVSLAVTESGDVYLATLVYVGEPGMEEGDELRFYRSTDDGKTWTYVDPGLKGMLPPSETRRILPPKSYPYENMHLSIGPGGYLYLDLLLFTEGCARQSVLLRSQRAVASSRSISASGASHVPSSPSRGLSQGYSLRSLSGGAAILHDRDPEVRFADSNDGSCGTDVPINLPRPHQLPDPLPSE